MMSGLFFIALPCNGQDQSVQIWVGGQGNWSNPANWFNTSSLSSASVFSTVLIDDGNPTASVVIVDVNAAIGDLTVDANDSLMLGNGHSLTIGQSPIGGTISADGLIRLDGSTLATQLIVHGPGANLQGSGVIALSSSTSQIIGLSGSELLNLLGITVRGSGIVGGNSLSITNSGTLDADVPEMPMTIDPNDAGFENQGILKASNGGRLRLVNGVFNSTKGQILAMDESRVEIEGAKVIGAELICEGSGFFRTSSSPSTLDSVTLNGLYELGATQLTLKGAITNNGVISAIADQSFTGPPVFSQIAIPASSGEVSLLGRGELHMDIAKISSGDGTAGGTLVNGQDHALRGKGLLGANSLGISNLGTILADDDYAMVIDPIDSLVVVNAGTLKATGLGGLVLTGGKFQNNGLVEVNSGSKVVYTATATEKNAMDGALSGGVWRVMADDGPALLSIAMPGVFFNSADVLLSGASSSFPLINTITENSGSFSIQNGRSFTTVQGSFSNDGLLAIGVGCRFLALSAFSQAPGGNLKVGVDEFSALTGLNGLVANGVVTLGGGLVVEVSPGFTPIVGQPYHIVHAVGIVGAFSQATVPSGWLLSQSATDVMITYSPQCPADFDASGIVDIGDLITLIGTWGQCKGNCPTDLDHDGEVGIEDLLAVIAAWGPCP